MMTSMMKYTVWLFCVILYIFVIPNHWTDALSSSCVYEGYIKTVDDWYGFIANATFGKSGRMKFRFEYPTEKCCHSLLFYKDEQVSVINARMDCWQRQGLVQQDQLLRLTPRYIWSGCHQTSLGDGSGREVFICETGRSFTSSDNKLHRWRLALSNCASMTGLEAKYRVDVWGHIGACPPTTPAPDVVPYEPRDAPLTMAGSSNGEVRSHACQKKDSLITEKNWHGYLVNMSLNNGGGFRYEFKYPYSKQIQYVLLYSEADLAKFTPGQTCWERQTILTHKKSDAQIIELSSQASWNGCVASNKTGKWIVTCKGERRYSSPQNLYIALSNCEAKSGLELDYVFDVRGYMGDMCPASASLVSLSFCTLVFLLIILQFIISND